MALKQTLRGVDFFAEQPKECDPQIEAVFQRLQAHSKELARGKTRSEAKNAPNSNLRERSLNECGVDVMRVDGSDETTALRA